MRLRLRSQLGNFRQILLRAIPACPPCAKIDAAFKTSAVFGQFARAALITRPFVSIVSPGASVTFFVNVRLACSRDGFLMLSAASEPGPTVRAARNAGGHEQHRRRPPRSRRRGETRDPRRSECPSRPRSPACRPDDSACGHRPTHSRLSRALAIAPAAKAAVIGRTPPAADIERVRRALLRLDRAQRANRALFPSLPRRTWVC